MEPEIKHDALVPINTDGGSPGRLGDRIAYGVDGFVLEQMRRHSVAGHATPERVLHDLRALEEAPLYRAALEDPGAMFEEPATTEVSKRLLAPHRVGFFEWSWHSQHPLMFPDLLRTFRERRANQTARLRMLNLKLKGSTVAIVVNGFSSGHHLIERLAWPMRTFRRHRIGVALFALPFHGPRATTFPPEWPGGDLKMLFEGFRQAVWDLRIAIRALREAGVKHVGVIGMSLGGYTASLLATATSDVDFVVPYVPIASIQEFMIDHDLVPGEGAVQQEIADSYVSHLSQVTPMGRASQIAPERMTVISGELDRLATVKHGAHLAEHFGARHIVFRGAHLVQKGRARAFDDAFEGFERAGVLPRKR